MSHIERETDRGRTLAKLDAPHPFPAQVYILTEVSTPFLNNVFFCEKMGLKGMRTLSGLLLLVSYVPSRIALSPITACAIWVWWGDFAKQPAVLLGYLLGMLLLATVMNYFWWYKILVGCLKGLGVLRASSSKAKK